MTESVEATPVPPDHARVHRGNRLYQVAAWVAIIAGIVFIAGSVFFTGFAIGRHGGDGGWGHHGCMKSRGNPPMMGPEMMGPEMMGPPMTGPGMSTPGAPPPPRP